MYIALLFCPLKVYSAWNQVGKWLVGSLELLFHSLDIRDGVFIEATTWVGESKVMCYEEVRSSLPCPHSCLFDTWDRSGDLVN